MASFFKTTTLQNVEKDILSYIVSGKTFSLTLPDGKVYNLGDDEMRELQAFFKINNLALTTIPNTSQALTLQKKQDDKFRREIEKILFKSIYPNNWQMGTLMRELKMLLTWQDKRQRAIITTYEPHINRALLSLREKKRKWDEQIGWPSKELEKI